MKKILFTILLALGILTANAQDVKEADVPAAVKTSFAKNYPDVKKASWEKEGENFEVEFKINGTETSAVFTAEGILVSTEIEIDPSALPQGAKDYIKTNLPNKKIKEASKITDASGSVTFEAEVDETDYIFDANGNFLNKETEKDKDKD